MHGAISNLPIVAWRTGGRALWAAATAAGSGVTASEAGIATASRDDSDVASLDDAATSWPIAQTGVKAAASKLVINRILTRPDVLSELDGVSRVAGR